MALPYIEWVPSIGVLNLKEGGLPIASWLSEGVVMGVASIWSAQDKLVLVSALTSMLFSAFILLQ